MKPSDIKKFSPSMDPGGDPRFFRLLPVVEVSLIIAIDAVLFAFLFPSVFSVVPILIFGLSVVLVLLIVINRLMLRSATLKERESSFMPLQPSSSAPNPATGNKEEELIKANEKLRKTNQEFMETTQRLFERETELAKANKILKELDAVKSDFVSVAAHQLRTPLTGIKWSYLALLDKTSGPLTEAQHEIVDRGVETIDYAISVINDLLNTAKLEQRESNFNFTTQAIGPIIQEIVKQHQLTLEEKKIKFALDVPISSSLAFEFDKEKIAIVFDNILANAVKYTPVGGKISLRSFRDENNIKFKISDTGIGIPKKDLDKVFSRLFRSKNAVSFQTSGSGLGLYIAKTIIEKHGGKIELESVEKTGTTVTFFLPIKRDSQEK